MNSNKKSINFKFLIALIICISTSVISNSVQARCDFYNGWTSRTLPMTLPSSLAVGNHLPVGSVIHSQTLILGPSYQEYARCDNAADRVEFVTFPPYRMASGDLLTHASAPGIGFRIRITTGQVNGTVPFTQYPITPPLTSLTLGADPKLEVEVIKISNSGGKVPVGGVAQYAARTGGGASSANFTLYFPAETNLVTTTCQVSNPVISVPMGDVNTSVFSRVGSVSQARNFTIRLNCDPQANVNVTVDAVADPSRAQGVLSLSALPDKASGVGIQVLQNNAPVTFGQLKSIGTSAGGIYNIPMSARYYQTQGQVNSGKANGTATFTMTYN